MGALDGVTVIEMAGIGPGPFCSMLLADMGARVVRVDRANLKGTADDSLRYQLLQRGRPNIGVDLKNKEGVETVLKLIEKADILLEGFRPGVMERLGLGPDVAHKRNPKLVYGRMTGWGQTGPIAHAAGHDINYVSLSGALHAIGPAETPVPPLNLVGDFGGGALYLAMGVLAAYISAQKTGEGQVVDVSMVEGAASLMTGMYGALAAGAWKDEARGANRLDGGAHYYGVYKTKDEKFVSIGSIEPQFYELLLEHTGLKNESLPPQNDRAKWPDMRKRLEEIFRTKTRDEWCQIMEGTDICFAPILTMSEAMEHPHAKERGSFVEVDGVSQPGPAPKFSRTPSQIARGPAAPGADTEAVLKDFGMNAQEIEALRKSGAVA